MNKKWEYVISDEEKVKELQNKHGISETLANIFVNRGITEDKDIEVFLNPTRDDFHDPNLLPDIEKAIKRITQAKENNEKVVIYGDYDVDGITSITVLKKFLDSLNMNVDYYIPNRLDEGYGLNKQAVKTLSEKGYTLMITVDCGISGIEEIEYANSLKIDTIVTDHHEPLEELPNAIAVINPKRIDSKYPFRDLAGVGVVFKLIQALSIAYELDAKEYLKYLDIVCVGTISDIVPLVNENRVITKLGLKLLKQTKNVGLRNLMCSSGYKQIDSTSISFGIAPRINACGRMGNEEEALKLFLTDVQTEAAEITNRLNKYNKDRQETERTILEQAINKIDPEELKEKDVIVLAGENWHHGVIGIVSSKITDMFYKPSILLCIEGDIAKGSGRSIAGFDLHDALCQTSDLLEKYGGHEMAVGLTVKPENVQKLKERLREIIEKTEIENTVPIITIDKVLNVKDLSKELIEDLKKLEPYGEANKMPIFALKNMKIDSIRSLSEGKHLKLTLKSENRLLEAIGFQMGELANEYRIGDNIDIAGTIEINSYNDSVQVNLKSIMRTV